MHEKANNSDQSKIPARLLSLGSLHNKRGYRVDNQTAVWIDEEKTLDYCACIVARLRKHINHFHYIDASGNVNKINR